ncbi:MULTISPECIES: stage II sporulation protein P [Bacillaceae]|uniref:stage II sporulation protein P n=1 Tax=Bacillaceae TaxID=186817 RepID=UPI002964F866|nr:stage II sporulation protein P [Bacillus infantis]MDW2875677.1 stage II sporulation protein P [Bacillus infantis]
MKTAKPTDNSPGMIGSGFLKASTACLLFSGLVFAVSGAVAFPGNEYRAVPESIRAALSNMKAEGLYQLIGLENHHFHAALPDRPVHPPLSGLLFELSTNVRLNDPGSLLGRELPAFRGNEGALLTAGEKTNNPNMPIESPPPIESLRAEQEASLMNGGKMAGIDEETRMTTVGKKIVYIYFSHNRESFLPYLDGVKDIDQAFHPEQNITKVGERLKSALEAKGIGAAVDKTDIQADLSRKGWSYSQSYDQSREAVETALAADQHLSYLIDIHRDAKRKSDTTTEIDDVDFAKVAFIIGAEHKGYEQNLSFANELHNLLEKKYKGLSRGAFTKEGSLTNGKFNQDLSEHAILVEIGGVDNTFEELYRSAEALAEVFSEYYWQAEKVDSSGNIPAGKE